MVAYPHDRIGAGRGRPAAAVACPRGRAGGPPPSAFAGPAALASAGLDAAVFLLPLALSVAGMAPLAKAAFLACAVLRSVALVWRRPARYVAFVLWLVVLSPGVRHFVDWYAGFSQTNPVMLAPYCAVLAALPTAALHVLNRGRHAAVCAAMAVVIGLGAWTSLLTDSVQSPLLAAVRWLCPVVFGAYIWANAAALPEIRAGVIRTMRVAVPAVAAYGLVQFVSILPWDAYYMKMAPITSIGAPEPFQVRVFSTMNSPGSLAALLATGLLLLLPRIRGVEFATILLAFCAFFLTTQRAALAALTLTVLVLAAAAGRSGQVRAGVAKLCVAAAVAVAASVAVPGADKKLLGAFDSFSQLEQDNSAQERLTQYAQLSARLDASPFGSGLAWATNPNIAENGKEATLDSGVIDILVSFGFAGGVVFLGLLAVLLARGWSVASRSRDARAMAEFGVVVFGMSQLPFGGQHTAEPGIFLYLGLGLLLARACPVPGAARSRPAAAAVAVRA